MGNRAELGRVFVQAFKRLYYDLEPAAQQQAIEAGLAQAASVVRPVLTAHCEVAQRIGERLGLSEEIRGPDWPECDSRDRPHRRYRRCRKSCEGSLRRQSPNDIVGSLYGTGTSPRIWK